MKAPKKSRGVKLTTDMWDRIAKNGRLISYNDNLFIETCLGAMLDMIEMPEKRRLPLIIRMIDEAKVTQEEADLLTPSENKKKSLSRRKKSSKKSLNNVH